MAQPEVIVMVNSSYQPSNENANDVLLLVNCWQNVAYEQPNWSPVQCAGDTLLWLGFVVLSGMLGFLLTLHCIVYKRINSRCSWRIWTRNRVQVLTLSLLLTVTMTIKLTFLMEAGDHEILILDQMMRFLIWSLTLLNFMQSAATLVVDLEIKRSIRWLKAFIYVGSCTYIAFWLFLVIMAEAFRKKILDCHNPWFMVQNSSLVLLLIVFHYFAVKVSRELNK